MTTTFFFGSRLTVYKQTDEILFAIPCSTKPSEHIVFPTNYLKPYLAWQLFGNSGIKGARGGAYKAILGRTSDRF